MFDFSNKVVFLTGGTRGIGRSLLESFAKCNANVAYLYHSSNDIARSIDEEWKNSNVKVKGYCVDIRDYNKLKENIALIIEEFGTVDILINNAGITKDTYMMLMAQEHWNDVIDINLNGLFNVTQQLMPHFISNKAGKIVNVTSVSGIRGQACQTNYAASKAGIIGFTKSLAKEVAKKGINVNAIAPGYVETEMLDSIPEKVQQQFKKTIPVNRFASAKEIVHATMFLCSDYASYIHGEVLVVDGGLTA